MSKSGATSTLELYSASTPNGIKVAACLEELVARKGEQISYDPYPINLRKAENRSEAFGQLNPNKKIPVLVDPCGVSGERTIVFESGAELLYLAEKYNELIPSNGTQRAELLSWLFWGSTSLSTQVKLFGFYYKHCPHAIPYCVNRYTKEVNRLLDVLNSHLHDGRQYVMGEEYTIADICMWPWIYGLYNNYDNAAETVFDGLRKVPYVRDWYLRCMVLPSSQKAVDVCAIVEA